MKEEHMQANQFVSTHVGVLQYYFMLYLSLFAKPPHPFLHGPTSAMSWSPSTAYTS